MKFLLYLTSDGNNVTSRAKQGLFLRKHFPTFFRVFQKKKSKFFQDFILLLKIKENIGKIKENVFPKKGT